MLTPQKGSYGKGAWGNSWDGYSGKGASWGSYGGKNWSGKGAGATRSAAAPAAAAAATTKIPAATAAPKAAATPQTTTIKPVAQQAQQPAAVTAGKAAAKGGQEGGKASGKTGGKLSVSKPNTSAAPGPPKSMEELEAELVKKADHLHATIIDMNQPTSQARSQMNDLARMRDELLKTYAAASGGAMLAVQPVMKRKIESVSGPTLAKKADFKSQLNQAAQVFLGRPISKGDVAYATDKTAAGYVSIVSMPDYDANASFQGEPAESMKEAEQNAAKKAMEAWGEQVQQTKRLKAAAANGK